MQSAHFSSLFRIALAAFAACALTGNTAATDPEFAGSEKCGTCHQVQYKSWKQSYHSKMVRTKDEGILKDVVEQWGNGGPSKVNLTGAPAKLDDVVYVVGSKWKQRFLVKNAATGGHLFLDKQWNRVVKRWENYGNKNDWDTNCGTCHSTGFRLTSYDDNNPAAQKWSMSEFNVGCETCHGLGAKHVKSMKKADIYVFAGKPKAEQTRVCGYCHMRAENEKFKTPQGNPSEHLPHADIGKTRQPGEDWTRWYPEQVIIPGVQPEDKIDAVYKGDLAGMFKLDDIAKQNGFFDGGKHHQQYQEFLQSKHYTMNVASCSDCHSAHTGKKPMIVARDTCKQCHDASFTVEKYMPGTGQTVNDLFVRTHTFNKNQSRPAQTTATGEPEYYKKQ